MPIVTAPSSSSGDCLEGLSEDVAASMPSEAIDDDGLSTVLHSLSAREEERNTLLAGTSSTTLHNNNIPMQSD